MTRELKYSEAIREATIQCMESDASVYVVGLGVPDPKGVFGTTSGLQERFGESRVMDMPLAENAMTGVLIGSTLVGMRPIMCHQRLDFALLSLEQIINQAAKWHYTFAGKASVPMVIRLVVGRGWGQGPQHAQSLQAIFAHVPGLKVVLPATPHDAKGLLISSVEDDNTVIFIEHRWLHDTFGPVPESKYEVPLGKANVVREGSDVSVVATSHMVVEALRAAHALERVDIDVEVVDPRTVQPLDSETILASVRKTGRLVAMDTGWKSCGVSSEIVALAAEEAMDALRSAPVRMTIADCPTPTSASLCENYYPRAADLCRTIGRMLDRELPEDLLGEDQELPLDVPDRSFSGPF